MSAFNGIKDSEMSGSIEGGVSYSHFEEEKMPHGGNISKTRVGEFDRSSIGNLESAFDQPSMEEDYADIKQMKLQQLNQGRNNKLAQESNTMNDIVGDTPGAYDTAQSNMKLIS